MFKRFFAGQHILYYGCTNMFISILQKLPILGKYIDDKLYEDNAVKKVIGVVAFSLSLAAQFAMKLIYGFAFILIPFLVLREVTPVNAITYDKMSRYIFFVMTCVGGALVNTSILSNSDDDYMLLNVMRVNPTGHFIGKFLYSLAVNVFSFLIILPILDVSFQGTVLLVLYMAAFRCVGEALRLILFDIFRRSFAKIKNLDIIVMLISVYVAYFLPYRQGSVYDISVFLYNPVVMGVTAVAAFASAMFIALYSKYTVIAKNWVKLVDVEYAKELTQKARINAVTGNSQLEGKKVVTSRYENKKGIAYLNAIFFERNKKVFYEKVAAVVAIIVGFGVIVCGVVAVMNSQIKEMVWNYICTRGGYLLLLMYVFNAGEKMCKALFYNCDMSMLHYNYYKTRKSIMESYIIRVMRIAAYNLIPAAVMCIFFGCLSLVCGHIQDMELLIYTYGSVILLSIWFSIYQVYLYFSLDPYGKVLEVKNTTFFICEAGMGIIWIILTFTKLTPYLVMWGSVAVGIVFTIYSFGRIYKKGIDNRK